MKKQATIFDYVRMCKNNSCGDCQLGRGNSDLDIFCNKLLRENTDKANEIILKWCKEHPAKTRQDKLLEMFPNAKVAGGVIQMCPKTIEGDRVCQLSACTCQDCLRNYWLTEVDE